MKEERLSLRSKNSHGNDVNVYLIKYATVIPCHDLKLCPICKIVLCLHLDIKTWYREVLSLYHIFIRIIFEHIRHVFQPIDFHMAWNWSQLNQINPCHAEFNSGNIEIYICIFYYCLKLRRDGADSWTSLLKTQTCLSFMVNSMAAGPCAPVSI